MDELRQFYEFEKSENGPDFPSFEDWLIEPEPEPETEPLVFED